MNRNKLTIGLFGFGCVGYGLHEVLQKTPTLKTNIKTICVKNRNKARQLPAEYFTFDKYEILNDPEINVVVELIDDADAAFEIVSTALEHGKAVVTANKKMIAEHFAELLALQKQFNVPLLYEAACCASIPIIHNQLASISPTLGRARCHSVGVLNGGQERRLPVGAPSMNRLICSELNSIVRMYARMKKGNI